VLDLFCGSGVARIPLAERYKDRNIHYVGIDARPEPQKLAAYQKRELPLPRKPQQAAKVKAWREEMEKRHEAASKERLHADFYNVELELEKPEKLEQQLLQKLEKTQFDEIHFHMPDTTYAEPLNKSATESLAVIARFLKPGGRLYHLFQSHSPLLDFKPKLPLNDELPQLHEKYAENKERIRQSVKKAGLELHRYGLNLRPVTGKQGWLTGRKRTAEAQERVHEVYAFLAALHSLHGAEALQFIVLRKPKG